MRHPGSVPGPQQSPQREPPPRPLPSSTAGVITSPVAVAAGLPGSLHSSRPAQLPPMEQPRTPSAATAVLHQAVVRSDWQCLSSPSCCSALVVFVLLTVLACVFPIFHHWRLQRAVGDFVELIRRMTLICCAEHCASGECIRAAAGPCRLTPDGTHGGAAWVWHQAHHPGRCHHAGKALSSARWLRRSMRSSPFIVTW